MNLPLPREDAEDAVRVLVATRRAVPFEKWVTKFVEKGREARAARLPHNLV